MTLTTMNALLAVFALGAPPGNGGRAGEGLWQMVPMLLIMFAFFYVAILRPQQRRQKQHDLLMKSLRAGDRVTTSSGIIGTVVTVKDKSVSIRSADTKLEVLKTAISEITERESEPSPSQS